MGEWGLQGEGPAARSWGLLRSHSLAGATHSVEQDLSLSHNQDMVIVHGRCCCPERAARRACNCHMAPQASGGHHHGPAGNLELLLTRAVGRLGIPGETGLRLAVYASPENKKQFEEEKLLRQGGKLEKIQTRASGRTVKFLRSCHLEWATVNGLNAVRVPMSVVNLESPKSYKDCLAQQAAKGMAPTSSETI
ncbi:hypothetical protein GH733_004318 [Mirounga leonina]|nr:hypothetical protein GH733_004318 [Mirounga leonina]